MSNAQLEYVMNMLELMSTKQFLPAGMDAQEKSQLETDLAFRADQLTKQYEADSAALKVLELKKEESEAARKEYEAASKQYDKNIENLAKALPNVGKGLLTAVTAFKKNDPISGCAAVMDICAALAPLIGGLSAAGGPPGMLIGALFGLISQILTFFGPKSQSLSSQIKTILREMKAEDKQQGISTVHNTVTAYAGSLRDVGLLNHREEKLTEENLKAAKNLVKSLNLLEGNTITELENVMAWLKQPANQELALWPNILAILCQAWSDLLIAANELTAVLSTDWLQKHVTDDQTGHIAPAVLSLRAAMIAQLISLHQRNKDISQALDELVPVAQNRGMLWIVDDSKYGTLYAGTNIMQADPKKLGGEQKRIAVAQLADDKIAFNRPFHVSALEVWGTGSYDRTYHGVCKADYTSIAWTEVGANDQWSHGLSDIWALPSDNKAQLTVLASKGKQLKEFTLDLEQHKLNDVQLTSLDADLLTVRAIQLPVALASDPAVIENPDVLKGVERISYVGFVNQAKIHVMGLLAGGTSLNGDLNAPWASYKGLAIDAQYVWVFNAASVACATHADVIHSIRKQVAPRWIARDLDDAMLYTAEYHQHQAEVTTRPGLQGLLDLSSGHDGTLVAAVITRSVSSHSYGGRSVYSYYEFADFNCLYGSTFAVDLALGTLSIKWSRLGALAGVRVQKTPIYCWDLMQGLRVAMQQMIKQFDRSALKNSSVEHHLAADSELIPG